LPTAFKTGFIEGGEPRPDSTPQQCFIVNPTIGGSTEYSDGLQQVAFTAAVGANEDVDKTKVNTDIFKRFE
jgi:hypothetical protein